MALNAYITAVQTLLHDPNAQFYSTATLTTFINEARQQIALESESVRGIGSFSTVAAQPNYAHSAVTVPTAPAGITGGGGLIVPRRLMNGLTGVSLESRNWDWFNFYQRGIATIASARPTSWAPFQIGSNGIFYVAPIPDATYTINVDGAWFPINLAVDADPEAIPYPWTDAIQFYALFLAYTDSQRRQDADEAYATYELLMQRARGIVTPLEEETTFPGGLAARTPGGMVPPTPPQSQRG